MQAGLLNLHACRPGCSTCTYAGRAAQPAPMQAGHKKAPASGDTGARRVRPSEIGQNTKRGQASGLRGGGQDRRAGRTPLPSQVGWSLASSSPNSGQASKADLH